MLHLYFLVHIQVQHILKEHLCTVTQTSKYYFEPYLLCVRCKMANYRYQLPKALFVCSYFVPYNKCSSMWIDPYCQRYAMFRIDFRVQNFILYSLLNVIYVRFFAIYCTGRHRETGNFQATLTKGRKITNYKFCIRKQKVNYMPLSVLFHGNCSNFILNPRFQL